MSSSPDAAALRDALVEHVAETGFGIHGLHVRVGADVAEHRWAPDIREDIQSAAKALCVLAASIAADDGILDLDAPVVAALPEIPAGPGVAEVTLRHLFSMTSGIDYPWSETMMTDWPDLAVEFLGRPSAGRRFQYSNASTYTAMRAVSAVIGDPVAFIDERLLHPLGIRDVVWDRCPNGWMVAGGGVALRTEELARIGLLIRDGGMWEGCRLVSAERVRAMHDDWVETGSSPGYDRYALSGWGGPAEAWRIHGANGQIILFAGDTVVTFTADDHWKADEMAAFAVAAARG